jgi:hypothetical protein
MFLLDLAWIAWLLVLWFTKADFYTFNSQNRTVGKQKVEPSSTLSYDDNNNIIESKIGGRQLSHGLRKRIAK